MPTSLVQRDDPDKAEIIGPRGGVFSTKPTGF